MTFPLSRRTLMLSGLATGATLSSTSLLAQSTEGEAREVIEMVKGDENAPVTVIEYASFTCPHCRSFHENVFPQLKENFIDTGKVKFIYREVYFDRYGLWGGMLARCAGPDRYFGIVDLLYANQSTWPRGESPAEVAQNLYAIGRQAGMTNDQMDACLQDQDFAKALVEDFQTNAERDGINSTPSFMIDGKSYSNMGYPQFETTLNDLLGS